MHQAFSIGVISFDEQNKQLIPFVEFSMAETKAEDVIEIQRKTIEEFLKYPESVDKFAKLDLWFETQFKAEKLLLDFVENKLRAPPHKIRILLQAENGHRDLLSRQKILLEYIRHERDQARRR